MWKIHQATKLHGDFISISVKLDACLSIRFTRVARSGYAWPAAFWCRGSGSSSAGARFVVVKRRGRCRHRQQQSELLTMKGSIKKYLCLLFQSRFISDKDLSERILLNIFTDFQRDPSKAHEKLLEDAQTDKL